MFSSKVYTNTYKLFACDSKCGRAWGICDRPSKRLSDNPDDVFFIGDDELMFVPSETSTITVDDEEQLDTRVLIAHNKWCIRHCERLVYAESDDRLGPGDVEEILTARFIQKKLDLKTGYYNIPTKECNKIINNIEDI